MYRAKQNNKKPMSEKEEESVVSLDLQSRNKIVVGEARKMRSLSGLIMVVVLLVVAINWQLKNRLNLFNKEPETLIEEPINNNEGIKKKTKLYIEPERLVVINGELFEIKIYGNDEELVEKIRYDSRSLAFNKFEKEDEVEGSTLEDRLGELEIDLVKDGASNYWGRLVMEAVSEGVSQIEIGEKKMEVRVVEGFFDQSLNMKEASCSGNFEHLMGPYNLTAKSGPGLGEISLSWEGKANGVVYGKESWNYEFKINTKNNNLTLFGLEPGEEYYINIMSKECGNEIFAEEVIARGGYGGMTRENMENYDGLLPMAEGLLP